MLGEDLGLRQPPDGSPGDKTPRRAIRGDEEARIPKQPHIIAFLDVHAPGSHNEKLPPTTLSAQAHPTFIPLAS